MLEQTVALTGSSTRLLVRNYRYDPLGRLLGASSQHKEETFAFDPASNLLDPKAPRRPIHHPPPKLLDNLLRDYVGQHYTYDALGRRVAKYSKAHCPPGAGPAWIEQQQRTLNAQYDCGQNIYGWDGDTLAYETRYSDNPGERRLIHYSNRSTLPPRITHRLLTPDSGRLVPTVRTMTPVSITLSKRPTRRCMPCADTF
ncbi:hypothetical protein [Pseudomonas helleri]|uniref:hypothetical protein n=1 Tax=Pseudomonas helleri TaxID=1608996 RepID=UPI0006539A92|nr:hypothetical protein [Pseudomonas helleri]KMN03460.1 hypothetical protein TU84_21850 [Pseudomonas helleri]